MRSVFHSKFLVHVIHNLVLPHDVLQKKICLRGDLSLSFSFVRMFLAVTHYSSEPFLVSIFALFVSFSSEYVTVSWSFRSISDCAPFSMFVTIHSTSSLRERGFDTRHLCIETWFISAGCVLVAAAAQTRMFGVCFRLNLVLYLCNLFFST